MITAAKDYRIKSSDIFFFDNNIWMFLYSPIGNYAARKQREYGDLLEYIIQRQRPIIINSLVLSEFINANFRKEYEIWKLRPENTHANNYKEHFLKSPAYRSALQSVIASTKAILKITTKGNDDFNAVNVDSILLEMAQCDFNDAYYLELGRQKNFIIVTDDADLYRNNKAGITIITYRI